MSSPGGFQSLADVSYWILWLNSAGVSKLAVIAISSLFVPIILLKSFTLWQPFAQRFLDVQCFGIVDRLEFLVAFDRDIGEQVVSGKADGNVQSLVAEYTFLLTEYRICELWVKG